MSKSDTGSNLIYEIIKSIKNKKKRNLVCYVDDPNCDLHQNNIKDHQEAPNRTKIIRMALNKYGLNDMIEQIGSVSITKSDIELCHDKKYIETIFHCCKLNVPNEIPPPSTEISVKSIDSLSSILASVSSVFGAVDTVCGDCRIDEKKN